jgi:hypothetical protein
MGPSRLTHHTREPPRHTARGLSAVSPEPRGQATPVADPEPWTAGCAAGAASGTGTFGTLANSGTFARGPRPRRTPAGVNLIRTNSASDHPADRAAFNAAAVASAATRSAATALARTRTASNFASCNSRANRTADSTCWVSVIPTPYRDKPNTPPIRYTQTTPTPHLPCKAEASYAECVTFGGFPRWSRGWAPGGVVGAGRSAEVAAWALGMGGA